MTSTTTPTSTPSLVKTSLKNSSPETYKWAASEGGLASLKGLAILHRFFFFLQCANVYNVYVIQYLNLSVFFFFIIINTITVVFIVFLEL